MPYIGGKSQAGVYQRIINLIPPHATYLEPFFGGGAILRLKKPAARSLVCDRDARVLASLPAGVESVNGCALELLESYPWRGDEFVYVDPPYVLSTRGGRRYYRFEMTDAEHERLLRVLQRISPRVLLSHPRCPLYDGALCDAFLPGGVWTCEEFQTWTRGGTWRPDALWFNYPRPVELHTYEHVGADRRERWNIERRRRNIVRIFSAMPALERATLFAALVDVMRGAGPDSEKGVAGS
jgi:hypothetical protein